MATIIAEPPAKFFEEIINSEEMIDNFLKV
jgi:hypothetical protein